MSNYANVNPDSLKKINADIQKLMTQLESTKKEMQASCEESYRGGNRDVQFEKVRACITNSEDQMIKLKNFMTKYTDYLHKQENVIRKHLDKKGPKIN